MNKFECQLKSHGQLQLEFHARYPLNKKIKRSEYMLDMFIFTPSQLDLDNERYGVVKFLDDLQCYTRYTHPSISLSNLVDEKCDISPLARIKTQLDQITLASDVHYSTMLYELRTLANSYRGEIREIRLMLTRAINKGVPSDEIIERMETLFENVDKVQTEIQTLQTRFLDTRIPDKLREGLSNADEAISVKTEKVFVRLHKLFEKHDNLKPVQEKLIPKIEQQVEYRKRAGYGTIISPNDEVSNENFLYREGMLKRWAQSAMYMDVNRSRKAKQISQIFAGIAAGLAMVFAVGMALFASKTFGQNSMPWAIILVVAYIIKDRIKEVVRMILISKLPSLVSDLSVNLVDPAVGKVVGFTGSWVRFCEPSNLTEIVRRYRNIDSLAFRKLLPPENVIHYHKRIKLDSGKLFKEHSRINSITEILRLKLGSWLTEMDDPAESLCCAEDNELKQVEANRVYHVNIVLRLAAKKSTSHTTYKRYRVILTRKGIVRIENVKL